MSIKNILALTVLMNLGIYDIIQGEIIYGEDIPRINVSAIAGKWFMVASTMEADQSLCCINDIKSQSADNFTMHIVTESRVNERNRTAARKYIDIDWNATMKNDSNLIFTTSYGQPGPNMAIFDVVYNSYVAIYLLNVDEIIPSDASGAIVIFGRKKTLSDEILEKVKKSNFYRKAPKIESEIQSIDSTVCH